jgi:hypothetical protein
MYLYNFSSRDHPMEGCHNIHALLHGIFIDRFIRTGMRYFNNVSTVPPLSSGEGRLEVKS